MTPHPLPHERHHVPPHERRQRPPHVEILERLDRIEEVLRRLDEKI